MKEDPAPGEQKTFPDGSIRTLDHGSSGKNRWINPHDNTGDKETSVKTGGTGTPAPVLEDYKPPTMIDKEEWIDYNEYLTIDNPFLNITSYEQGQEKWYSEEYELQERIEIIKEQQRRAKAEPDADMFDAEKEINSVEAAMIKVNNQFIALQCYKMCLVIHRINYFDHGFDYDKFVIGKTWKDVMAYLDEVENG